MLTVHYWTCALLLFLYVVQASLLYTTNIAFFCYIRHLRLQLSHCIHVPLQALQVQTSQQTWHTFHALPPYFAKTLPMLHQEHSRPWAATPSPASTPSPTDHPNTPSYHSIGTSTRTSTTTLPLTPTPHTAISLPSRAMPGCQIHPPKSSHFISTPSMPSQLMSSFSIPPTFACSRKSSTLCSTISRAAAPMGLTSTSWMATRRSTSQWTICPPPLVASPWATLSLRHHAPRSLTLPQPAHQTRTPTPPIPPKTLPDQPVDLRTNVDGGAMGPVLPAVRRVTSRPPAPGMVSLDNLTNLLRHIALHPPTMAEGSSEVTTAPEASHTCASDTLLGQEEVDEH